MKICLPPSLCASPCSNPVLKYNIQCFQAFRDTWELACSFSGRTRIVLPAGNTFLIHPIDIAGPCQSKITLQVHSKTYSDLY